MTVLWSMRVLMATAIAVAVAALAGGAEARDVSIYRGKCGEAVLPTGPTRLASPITIDTTCGEFVISSDGVGFSGPGTTSASGGAGQAVSVVHEQPFGWTRAGLRFTYGSGVLTFRTRSGRAVIRLRTAQNRFWFDALSRTLFFVSRGEQLVRTDGRRTQTLRSVSSPGLAHWSGIQPLPSGRIALLGRRVFILDPDGAVVAAEVRRRGAIPVESRNGAIAIISNEKAGNYARARESVRLLLPGERSSKLLYVNDFSPSGCGRWPSLAWRGNALLYSTTEGKVVVIDTGSGKLVDLTSLVADLPGDFFQAGWS